jgi:hypothetical protein
MFHLSSRGPSPDPRGSACSSGQLLIVSAGQPFFAFRISSEVFGGPPGIAQPYPFGWIILFGVSGPDSDEQSGCPSWLHSFERPVDGVRALSRFREPGVRALEVILIRELLSERA